MKNPRPVGLLIIGIYKLFKGVLFLLLGIGVLRLVGKDVDDVFLVLVHKLHIDSERRFIQDILARLSLIDARLLKEISLASFALTLLFVIEGWGLVLQKVWAEYMAVVESAVFIPLEIFEIIRRTTEMRLSVLAINIVIVIYLMRMLMKKSCARKAELSRHKKPHEPFIQA